MLHRKTTWHLIFVCFLLETKCWEEYNIVGPVMQREYSQKEAVSFDERNVGLASLKISDGFIRISYVQI